jgi:hypothetical protein
MSRLLCILFSVVMLLSGCGDGKIYKQQAKTLDSLGGAIGGTIRSLSLIDTQKIDRCVIKFENYSRFILQDVRDTLDRSEADALQGFHISGKNLKALMMNRRAILSRCGQVSSQLDLLSTDVKERQASPDLLARHIELEKAAAVSLLESGRQTALDIQKNLDAFITSVHPTESLIRKRNAGELPVVINDNEAKE